jgi:hypothetical protein
MSGLKLKVLPQFPSQVIGDVGITVNKQNGNFLIDLDYSKFPPHTNTPSGSYVLVYDLISKTYTLVPGGNLADGPVDGSTYGRSNSNWVKVLPLTGGTLSGSLILNADPTAALGAATKQYVDAHISAVGIPEAPNDGTIYGRKSLGWSPALDFTGGTLTGPLILAADPTVPLGASTKQYVDNKTVTLTGDVTGSGTASIATTLAPASVGNAKMANAAANTLKGNPTGSVASPQDFTIGSLTAKATPVAADALLIADSAASGALKQVPWSSLPGGGGGGPTTLTGDVTGTGSGTVPTTIANSAVTNAKLANSAAYTLKGNATAASAAPQDFTIGSLTTKATPAGADSLMIADSAASGALKQAAISSLPYQAPLGYTPVNKAGDTITGALTVNGVLAVNNDIYAVRPATPSTGAIYLGNGGHYLYFDGTNYSMPSGGLTVGGPITSTNGIITCNSNFATTASIGIDVQGVSSGSGYYQSVIGQASNGALSGTSQFRAITYTSNWGGGSILSLGATTFDFHNNGVAYNAAGGSWASNSDARIKTVLRDYGSGLAEIKQLRPVVYLFKGNYTDAEASDLGIVEVADSQNKDHKPPLDLRAPYPNSNHYYHATNKIECIGLVAQEAERPMPELVSQHPGYIDGNRVEDARDLNPSALVYALINAVKELSARVEQLEARLT